MELCRYEIRHFRIAAPIGATRGEHSDRSVLELDISKIDSSLENIKSQWDPDRVTHFTDWSK